MAADPAGLVPPEVRWHQPGGYFADLRAVHRARKERQERAAPEGDG